MEFVVEVAEAGAVGIVPVVLAVIVMVVVLINHLHFLFQQLPGPSTQHMTFRNKRNCSKLEHHEGSPRIERDDSFGRLGKVDSGSVILTNMVKSFHWWHLS